MDAREQMRILKLLLCCYDDTASREDITELEEIVTRSREALEYYVEISMNLNYFHCLMQIPLSQPESVEGLDTEFMSELGPQQQLALLKDFAEYEKNAAVVEIAKSEGVEERELIRKINYQRPVRTINKFSLAAAVLSIAAILLMVVFFCIAPPASYEVATVIDSIDAEWSSSLPISPGSRLTSNFEPIWLTRGIVKLKTDDQVEIVLEAPTEFYFRSYSEISMNYGKLFARVSEQGSGFSVVTPNSKIVDLGTEFGVLGHINGNTEVHLYKGRANVFAGEKRQPKTSQLLTAGFAVEVDSHDSSLQTIDLDERALVRNIDSKANLVWRGQKVLRLTDLLLGGNGFGTASRKSIEYDPLTGVSVSSTDAVAAYRKRPKKMVMVPENPYLDSIFIPDGREDVLISSAGHRFQECPKTSGLFYSNIICRQNQHWDFFEPLQERFERTRKKFPGSGLLYLHSNIGLTVDLNAVRHVVPGFRIPSFSAFVGINRIKTNKPDYSEVDIWVLVDGQLRSSRKALRADQGFDVHVDLSEDDKFLTLIVTDGEKRYSKKLPPNELDTCGFAEPVFELAFP